MKIVMLSDALSQGGAAIAATRLAEGLLERGHECIRLVSSLHGSEKKVPNIKVQINRWQWRIYKQSEKVLGSNSFQKKARMSSEGWLERQLKELKPDVINIHNLHFGSWLGWTERMVEICEGVAPTVWTLHDCWSFTGRCGYAFDCEKFLDGCDRDCPTAAESPILPVEDIRPAWENKKKLFASTKRLYGCAPSKWLAQEAVRGFWNQEKMHHLPYGVPLDRFISHENRLEARMRLGLPEDRLLALVVADELDSRRKGADIVLEALAGRDVFPFDFVTMGRGSPYKEIAGLMVHDRGFVSDESKKIDLYNAADFMIHPAPVDNLPNVVLEALACGTPVVGFPIGGMPDMVREDESGWLAREVTAVALMVCIDRAIVALKQGDCLRKSCRKIAESEYNLSKQAQSYEKIFQAIIKKDNS